MKVHKIPFILVFSILINILPQLTFAEDYSFLFSYSPSKMQIEITVDGLPSGGTPVVVSVYPEPENRITAELINEQKAVSRIFYSQKNQALTMAVALPEDMPSGTYTARVSCEFMKEQRGFTHINSGQGQDILKKLNTAADAAEFAEILRQHMTVLGIDSSVFEEYSPQLENDLFTQRGMYFKEGYDIESFNLSFNSLTAQYKIKAPGADIDALLRQYADILKISYTAYSDLPTECRQYFEDYLIQLDSAKEPLYRFYELCILKARLAAAKRYQEFQTLIEENAAMLGITVNVSGNTAVAVFKRFYERRNEILSDITQAAAIFEECVKAVQSQISSKPGSSSSSSGIYWIRNESHATNPPETPQTTVSPDLKTLRDIAGHWAENVIMTLYEKKIISGYDDETFRPDMPVSRAEFIAMTVAALDLKQQGEAAAFADVSADSWYHKAVMRAASCGVVLGNNGMLYPEQSITRQDAAVILWRALESCGYSPDGLAYFEDRDSIADYAYDAVYRLAGADIIHGFENDCFIPQGVTTRAQTAQLLSTAMEYMERKTQVEEGGSSSLPDPEDTDYTLAHAAVSYIGAAELLTEGDFVTKADFTAAVVKAAFLDEIQLDGEKVYEDVGSSDKNFAAIGIAYRYGIIGGGRRFYPDSAISQNEAIKMCAAVVDASVHADDTAYITYYSSKLTDNLKSAENGELTVRNAEVLLYNMIRSKRSPKTVAPLKDDGECILSARYQLYTTKDIVTANELTALDGPNGAVPKTRLQIGDYQYVYSGGEELIGYKAEVLYKEDDDERIAIAVIPTGNEELSLVPHDILSFSENEIQWRDDQGRIKRCRLKSTFDYLYNEKAAVGALPKSLEDVSEIKLIDYDRDGRYDVIKVIQNDYMVVSAADYQTLIFSDKNTLQKQLVLSGGRQEYRLVGCDSIYDITPGTAIAYASSEDGLYTKITVLTDTVSGTVDSSGENKMVIDDKEYYCSRYYLENFEKVGVGVKGEFILDPYQNVVALSAAVSKMSFGFLVNTYDDENGFFWAKIFTDSGKMEKMILCDKVRMDSRSLEAEIATAQLCENGKTKRQLIRYRLNNEGKIAVIDTKVSGLAEQKDEFVTQNISDSDGLVLYRFGEPDADAHGEIPTYGSVPTKSYPLVYRRSTLQFYPKFNINGSIIFVVPASEAKANDEKMYHIGSNASFKQSTEGIYNDTNILAYNIDNSGAAEAVVCFTDDFFLKPAGSAQSAVVQEIYDGYHEEYGNCRMVRLWMNKNFSEYILDEDMVFEKRTGGTLCPGDIIRFTEYEGVIKNMVVDFDAAKSSFKATAPGMFNVGTLTMSYQSGLLYSVNESYVYLAPELGGFIYDTRRSALNNAKINTKNVVIIHMKSDKSNGFKVSEITPAESSDLRTYETFGDSADYILLRQKELSPEMLFAYRFEE